MLCGVCSSRDSAAQFMYLVYYIQYNLNILYVCFCIVGKIDFHHVKLVFWDLGGQEELQTLWDKVTHL